MKAAPQIQFESAFLTEIVTAFEQRGKAIRYHGELKLSRDLEESGERLNVDHEGLDRCRVRLSIWADGVFWMGMTQPGPRREGGWAFKDEFSGNLRDKNAARVVVRFEETINGPGGARKYWQGCLEE